MEDRERAFSNELHTLMYDVDEFVEKHPDNPAAPIFRSIVGVLKILDDEE
jgi:hypothetical protein